MEFVEVRCSSTLLFKWIAPVKNSPAGTTTRPPPASAQASIVFAIAAVQSVWPSVFAPNLVMTKSRAGNFGGTMRARIPGTCDHSGVSARSANVTSKRFRHKNWAVRAAFRFMMSGYDDGFRFFRRFNLRPKLDAVKPVDEIAGARIIPSERQGGRVGGEKS